MTAAGMARGSARQGSLSVPARAARPTAAPARRAAPPPPRRRARPAAAAEAAEAEAEAGGDDAVCAPAFVSVDNRKNKNFTVMEVSGEWRLRLRLERFDRAPRPAAAAPWA